LFISLASAKWSSAGQVACSDRRAVTLSPRLSTTRIWHSISDGISGVAMRLTSRITPSWYQSPWSGYGDSFFPWRCVSSFPPWLRWMETGLRRKLRRWPVPISVSRSFIAGAYGRVEWCVQIYSYCSWIRGATRRRGYWRAPWEWWVGESTGYTFE